MEQQIKEEIKEYMFSFYSGILPICSEERINEIINDTYKGMFLELGVMKS